MKFIVFFLLSISVLFGAEGAKDVDLGNLFNQLDKVISAKKDTSKVKKSKAKHTKKKTSKREKNYKKFNEAAKKYHIFRAKRILKTVKSLINDYQKKSVAYIEVHRYSFLGNKKFATVSGYELSEVVKQLEIDGKILKNLQNYKTLLSEIKEYDIKTIAKVLIIVEQEIMNLNGMGIKKSARQIQKDVQDIPMLLKLNQIYKNKVEVVAIDESNVKLKVLN
jgi:hypothetical protein